MADGKSIVSGWSDGNIRAFTPQSGTLLYSIEQAHKLSNGVSALSCSKDCTLILSGSGKGEVKLWQIGKQT
jgi:WD40 repeat protein